MADVIPVKRYSTGLAELQSGDTIAWSWLSSIPVYATRWPVWTEVTGKPTTFAPAAHTHTWADITGTVPTWNQNTTGSAASLTTARTLTIGSTGKTFNGSANVAWTLSEIGALAASAVGAASGVAPLGTDTKVPASYLPSYVDDVLEYSSLSAFPTTGETGKIYVADNTGKIYRWSGSTYIEISPSPGSTDAVPEGATNLYFTTARAAAAAPVQSVNGKTGVVSLTYTDVSAAPSSHIGAGGTAHAEATTSTDGFMSASDKTKLNGIAAGATANTGTVTSVGISAPTGLSVSDSPVTTSGTLALSWASDYQGYTTTEATKLSGIAAGATVGATWGTDLSSIPANITRWASIAPSSKADDSAVVHLTGNESISGSKTFTGNGTTGEVLARGSALGSLSAGVTAFPVNGNRYSGFFAFNSYQTPGSIEFYARENHSYAAAGIYMSICLTPIGSTTRNQSWIFWTDAFTASSDNYSSAGSAARRFTQVFAVNSTINTSDARLKTTPRDMTEAEIAAFGQIGRLPCVWQWLAKVETEGNDARLHSGPTVQAAMAIMEANGLDWQRYSAFCYDEWEAFRGDVLADGEAWSGETEAVEEADTDPETGETSAVTRTYKVNPAGDRYSFRKEELLWWCMRALFAEKDALAARVAALESE